MLRSLFVFFIFVHVWLIVYRLPVAGDSASEKLQPSLSRYLQLITIRGQSFIQCIEGAKWQIRLSGSVAWPTKCIASFPGHNSNHRYKPFSQHFVWLLSTHLYEASFPRTLHSDPNHGPVDSVSKALTQALGGHAAPLMTKELEFDNKTNEKQWLRTKPWAGSNVESLSPKMKHESVEKGHFNL